VIITWQGLTLASKADGASSYHASDITGWEVTPQISFADVAIGGRGVAVTPGSMGPRVVTVTGWCYDSSRRDLLLASLWSNASPSVGVLETDALVVTHGGLTLQADAQLMKADATPEAGWAGGRFGFTLQWRCPDPMRYGAWTSVTAGIEAPVAGLVYPVTYPVTYPAQTPSGQLSVFNPGNAQAPALITLSGPLGNSPGVSCVTSGAQVRFGFALAAGDVLVVDTAQGAAFLNGEFRSPLTASSLFDELRVPVGASTFQSLGDPTGSGASVSVAFRPAFW